MSQTLFPEGQPSCMGYYSFSKDISSFKNDYLSLSFYLFLQLDSVMKCMHVNISVQYIVKVILIYAPHLPSCDLGVYEVQGLSLPSLLSSHHFLISLSPIVLPIREIILLCEKTSRRPFLEHLFWKNKFDCRIFRNYADIADKSKDNKLQFLKEITLLLAFPYQKMTLGKAFDTWIYESSH